MTARTWSLTRRTSAGESPSAVRATAGGRSGDARPPARGCGCSTGGVAGTGLTRTRASSIRGADRVTRRPPGRPGWPVLVTRPGAGGASSAGRRRVEERPPVARAGWRTRGETRRARPASGGCTRMTTGRAGRLAGRAAGPGAGRAGVVRLAGTRSAIVRPDSTRIRSKPRPARTSAARGCCPLGRVWARAGQPDDRRSRRARARARATPAGAASRRVAMRERVMMVGSLMRQKVWSTVCWLIWWLIAEIWSTQARRSRCSSSTIWSSGQWKW